MTVPPCVDVRLEDVENHRGRDRIQRLERLVEHENTRRVDHRAGEHDLLRHARRVVGDHTAEGVDQVEGAREIGHARLHDRGREPAQHTVVVEELTSGETIEGSQTVRQHADEPLRPRRVGRGVDSAHLDRAAVGAQQPGDHRERGRLAGTVRPDESEERPRRHRQVDAVDGTGVAELLDDAAQGQGRCGRRGRVVVGHVEGVGIDHRCGSGLVVHLVDHFIGGIFVCLDAVVDTELILYDDVGDRLFRSGFFRHDLFGS